MKLETRLQRQLQAHIQKRHGLITVPDVLLDYLLQEVEGWLAEQKNTKHIAPARGRREVLDELSAQIRKEVPDDDQ